MHIKFVEEDGHAFWSGAAATYASLCVHFYADVNVHSVHSPRDDLEALGYIIIQMLRGSLPWQVNN